LSPSLPANDVQIAKEDPMNEPIVPTLEPILIPEGAKKRKKKSRTPAVVISKPEPEVPKSPKPPEPPAEPKPEKFTLAHAFDYFYEPDGDEITINIERATRAVAFLMHWCSEMGNDDVEGRSVTGLAHILERIASEVARWDRHTIVYRGAPPKGEPPKAS
jgi:hypothetical protein